VKEVLRWAPVTPLGIPHRSIQVNISQVYLHDEHSELKTRRCIIIQDDWYNGYFIPKHSVIIPNYWCMNRSTEIYGPDAHHFNPARYLDGNGQMAPAPPDTKEEGHITFGFGRRYCIGARVSNESMFINIAIMLWAMNIKCAIDAGGNPIPLDVVDCVEDGLVV